MANPDAFDKSAAIEFNRSPALERRRRFPPCFTTFALGTYPPPPVDGTEGFSVVDGFPWAFTVASLRRHGGNIQIPNLTDQPCGNYLSWAGFYFGDLLAGVRYRADCWYGDDHPDYPQPSPPFNATMDYEALPLLDALINDTYTGPLTWANFGAHEVGEMEFVFAVQRIMWDLLGTDQAAFATDPIYGFDLSARQAALKARAIAAGRGYVPPNGGIKLIWCDNLRSPGGNMPLLLECRIEDGLIFPVALQDVGGGQFVRL